MIFYVFSAYACKTFPGPKATPPKIRRILGQKCNDARPQSERQPSTKKDVQSGQKRKRIKTPEIVNSDEEDTPTEPQVNAKGHPTVAGKCPRKEYLPKNST